MAEAAPEPPRLVLLLAVDQLLPARVDPTLPGGLGRLAREGRSFGDAQLGHARTETCPGHAVMLTGRHPGPAGLPGNRYIENGTLRVRYCVEDDTPAGGLLSAEGEIDSRVLDAAVGGGERGRSPRNMRVDALGDWLKAAHPEARVFAVSAKDRAAIVLGGQQPDAAYWLDRKGSGAFTTSRYYRASLPDWVLAWDRDRVLQDLPPMWSYDGIDFHEDMRSDDFASESSRFGRSAPHPLGQLARSEQSLSPVEASPYLDNRTLAFARDLVEQEELGADDVPDLLAVSLSATDIVGHLYGPMSREAWASLVMLDEELGAFFSFLEARAGVGRVVVALTADHGVLALPEWIATQDDAPRRCPDGDGRISPRRLDSLLASALVNTHGLEWKSGWVRDGFTIGFNAVLAEREGVSLEELIATTRAALEPESSIERVWSRRDLREGDGDDEKRRLYVNNLSAGRGGDVFIEPVYGCLFTDWPSGTSHGSPHDYDLAVPLLFWGPGVEPGRIGGASGPVDLAPTLARLLGISVPADLDGRVLPLD